MILESAAQAWRLSADSGCGRGDLERPQPFFSCHGRLFGIRANGNLSMRSSARVFLISFVFLVFRSPIFAAENDAVEVRTLSGQFTKGTLESINDKEIVVSGHGRVPIDQVLDLTFPDGTAGSSEGRVTDVELVDGSLLHCSQLAIKGKNVELKLLSGQEIKDLPLAAISYVLNDAQETKVREEWQRFLAKKGNHDLVAIKSKDGVINPLEGTFGEVDAEGKIAFESVNGIKGRLSLDRLHGLAFFRRPDPEAVPALFRATDTFKNLWVVAKAGKGENGYLLQTVAGVKVEYPLKSFTRWDFSKGKLTYLSDLEPKPTELSNVERIEHYRRDKNLEGEQIQLTEKNGEGGSAALKKYPKGLCLHAHTELLYDIGGEYKEFKAVLGMDPKVTGDSHVKVTIEGDGKELFSAEMRRRDDSRPVTLNVKGVKQLRIVVASAGLLDLGNHLCLADAKVSK
jgi:hypothetical protein